MVQSVEMRAATRATASPGDVHVGGVNGAAAGPDYSDPYLSVFDRGCCKGNPKIGCWMLWLVVGIAALILVIVIPKSFTYVELEEWGLKKNAITHTVYTDDVYEFGRYGWGPAYTVLTFPRPYQRDKACLEIFNSNGVEFLICIEYYWRIIPDQLLLLFKDFPNSYREQVDTRANAAIKNVAPRYTIEDFKNDRPAIRVELHAALQTLLEEVHIEVPYYLFALSEIKFPPAVTEKDIDTAVQRQVNVQEEYVQQADLVRKETQRLAEAIRANTTLVILSGEATANRIRVNAGANSDKIHATADINGLHALFEGIGLPATTAMTAIPGSAAATTTTDATTTTGAAAAIIESVRQRYITYFAFREQVEKQNAAAN